MSRAGTSCGLALLAFLFGSKTLQNAVAEGDTRTISLHHIHTDEDITITYKRDGRYDEAALEKLNWFLRDWRRGEQTRMDPHLIDLIWEVRREVGTSEPVHVVCGYRSPQTNAMLRHRSKGVARFSQHMLGHAMDFFIPGVSLAQVREYGLRLQRGGVGFYPESGSPFVHMDTADVRMWPRMTREELARVFPNGRTVHIPADGKPLAGYALALADVRKRGGAPSATSIDAARGAGVDVDTLLASNERPRANPLAKLLGLAKDDEEDSAEPVRTTSASPAPTPSVVAAPVAPAKHPVLAALAHDAQIAEKATAKAAIKVADAAAKVKFVRTADAAPLAPLPPPTPPTPPTPAQAAQSLPAPSPSSAAIPAAAKTATTPSQAISARGYWQGPQDSASAPQPAANVPAASAPRPRRVDVASAAPDATGTIGPFPSPRDDRAAAELALAYAEQPGRQADRELTKPATPTGIAALRAAAPAQPVQGAAAQPAAAPQPAVGNATTIAMKRTATQVSSAIVTAGPSAVAVIKSGPRFENPWLRAVVVSPSVHRFLTTMALGGSDFRSLATLMVKPANAVMMTFAADPNPGLAHDRFTGAAIVFVSTVSYPTRTAALR